MNMVQGGPYINTGFITLQRYVNYEKFLMKAYRIRETDQTQTFMKNKVERRISQITKQDHRENNHGFEVPGVKE